MSEKHKSGTGGGGGRGSASDICSSYPTKRATSVGYLLPPVKANTVVSLPPSPKNQPLSIPIPNAAKSSKQTLEPLHRSSSPSLSIHNHNTVFSYKSNNSGTVAPPSSLVDTNCSLVPKRNSLSLVLDPDFKNLSMQYNISTQWDEVDNSEIKNGHFSPINSGPSSTTSSQSGRLPTSVFSFSPTQKVTIHDILHRTSKIVGNAYLQHCNIQDYTQYALVSDDLHNRLQNRLLQVSIETVCEWYKEFRYGLDPSQYISIANTPLSTKLLFPL